MSLLISRTDLACKGLVIKEATAANLSSTSWSPRKKESVAREDKNLCSANAVDNKAYATRK